MRERSDAELRRVRGKQTNTQFSDRLGMSSGKPPDSGANIILDMTRPNTLFNKCGADSGHRLRGRGGSL